MKPFENILTLFLLCTITISCIDIKKYQKNILEGEVQTEKENTVSEKAKNATSPVEIRKTTYKNINYLSEKTAIYNDSLLDENVIKRIKTYYYEKYDIEWKELFKENGTYVKLPAYESRNDSIAYLGFQYAEDDTADAVVVGMINCSIPTKQGINLYMSNPILYTDLNNDGTNDLIVVVHTEGGWRGGNVYNQDIFVFLKKNGVYKFTSVTSDWDMVDPNMYGYIRVKNVENGILLADAYIYTENSARCCPSDHYFMKYKFKDNKFVILSSEFIGNKY